MATSRCVRRGSNANGRSELIRPLRLHALLGSWHWPGVVISSLLGVGATCKWMVWYEGGGILDLVLQILICTYMLCLRKKTGFSLFGSLNHRMHFRPKLIILFNQGYL
jgi:hypothetical protein